MPAKNSRKVYIENGYYHIYNRGVEKRIIFMDEKDYGVFLGYLKEYLLPKDEEKLGKKLANPKATYQDKDKILKLIRMNNFSDEIILLAYCLMPNHFHLFIKQTSSDSMHKFMNSLGTRYSMYFNRRYKRVGPLYQGVYKAVQVTTEPQFLYLSKYIHKQSLASQGQALQAQPSSYSDYVGDTNTPWVDTREILSYFNKNNPDLNYKKFVLGDFDDREIQGLKNVALDAE